MGSNIDFCFQDGSYEYTGHKTDFHAYLGIFGSTGHRGADGYDELKLYRSELCPRGHWKEQQAHLVFNPALTIVFREPMGV